MLLLIIFFYKRCSKVNQQKRVRPVISWQALRARAVWRDLEWLDMWTMCICKSQMGISQTCQMSQAGVLPLRFSDAHFDVFCWDVTWGDVLRGLVLKLLKWRLFVYWLSPRLQRDCKPANCQGLKIMSPFVAFLTGMSLGIQFAFRQGPPRHPRNSSD